MEKQALNPQPGYPQDPKVPTGANAPPGPPPQAYAPQQAYAPPGAPPPSYDQSAGLTNGQPGAPPPANYGLAPGQAPYQGQTPYQGQPYVAPTVTVPVGYNPPGTVPGAYPQPPPGTTILVQPQLNRFPANCMCPNCHQNIVTQTFRETGTLTWLAAGGICLMGGWVFCLCLIPFCIDDLMDVRHQCPNCKHNIHIYRRM